MSELLFNSHVLRKTYELLFKLGQRFLDALVEFRKHGLGLIKRSVLHIVNGGS